VDALLTSFVGAFLCTWGDRTQLVVAALAETSRRPTQIFAGLLLAALASNVVAAVAGIWMAAMINLRAMTLMVALALLFAGISGLIPRKAKESASPRWALASAFILCLAAEMGDRTQFLTFAFAGKYASAPLAAAGATAGILAACLPALALGERLRDAVPLRPIRYGIAALLLVTGFITAVKALQIA